MLERQQEVKGGREADRQGGNEGESRSQRETGVQRETDR
jgi:hypothetical protein